CDDNFGLINHIYAADQYSKDSKDMTQQQRFYREPTGRLNDLLEAPKNVQYNVFFFYGRHGDGYHADAEA
ncbi:hypothetical protein H0H92_016142, partial [Tricholoma furcatifolium]